MSGFKSFVKRNAKLIAVGIAFVCSMLVGKGYIDAKDATVIKAVSEVVVEGYATSE